MIEAETRSAPYLIRQAGDDLELQHFLHYFKSEDQASDVSEGGVIDLGDVDEVRRGASPAPRTPRLRACLLACLPVACMRACSLAPPPFS